MKLIEDNSQGIPAICEKHKVSRLFVFGSILTDRFNEDSDVDMVVDLFFGCLGERENHITALVTVQR